MAPSFRNVDNQIDLGRLDRRMAEPLLQVVDRPASLEPIDGVPMAHVMEAERPKIRFLKTGLLGVLDRARMLDADERSEAA